MERSLRLEFTLFLSITTLVKSRTFLLKGLLMLGFSGESIFTRILVFFRVKLLA